MALWLLSNESSSCLHKKEPRDSLQPFFPVGISEAKIGDGNACSFLLSLLFGLHSRRGRETHHTDCVCDQSRKSRSCFSCLSQGRRGCIEACEQYSRHWWRQGRGRRWWRDGGNDGGGVGGERGGRRCQGCCSTQLLFLFRYAVAKTFKESGVASTGERKSSPTNGRTPGVFVVMIVTAQ